jgi:DNA-binding FadR family transcriptional regulator
MPYQAVDTQRRYQQVAQQLERMIAAGETAPGERLPAERELATLFGVSRPTIREAMIALEIARLVEIRTGSGIYVRKDSPLASDGPGLDKIAVVSGPGPFEILAARLLIEPQVAAEAARKATPGDLAAIRSTVVEMRDAPDYRTSLELDQQFHVMVARASQNFILASIVEEMWRHMFSPMYEAMSSITGLSHTRSMDVDDHSKILRHIELRSAAQARKAMREHLTNVKRVLSRPKAQFAAGSTA